MGDEKDRELTKQYAMDALQHINKTRIGRSIVSMDNRQLLAMETMFLFHSADTLARIYGIEGSDLEYNLYTLLEISCRINLQTITDVYNQTGNEAVILLLYSTIFKLIATEQIRKRFAEKPIREKSLVYYLTHKYATNLPSTFEDGEDFLEDARKMTLNLSRNSGTLSNIIDQWRKGKRQVVIRPDKYDIDEKEGLAGGDFLFDALDLYDDYMNTYLIAVDTGDFSNLPATPASRYLPEPHTGWDEYLKSQLILQIEAAIRNGLAHLDKAEKLPFDILNAIQEKYKESRDTFPEIELWEDREKQIKTPLEALEKKEEEITPYAGSVEQGIIISMNETFSPKQQEDILKIIRLSREKNPSTGKTFTQTEIGEQIGRSTRTVGELIKKWKPIDKLIKKHYRPVPTRERKTPAINTDRVMSCPQCGTTFPPGMKKTKDYPTCPSCPGVKLERGYTFKILDPVTKIVKETIRKKAKEKTKTDNSGD